MKVVANILNIANNMKVVTNILNTDENMEMMANILNMDEDIKFVANVHIFASRQFDDEDNKQPQYLQYSLNQQ